MFGLSLQNLEDNPFCRCRLNRCAIYGECDSGRCELADCRGKLLHYHDKNPGYGGNQKASYRYLIDKGFDMS